MIYQHDRVTKRQCDVKVMCGVQVEQSGVVRRGVARSVEKDGSLCCTGEEDFCVHGGEASVRGLYGYV